MAVLENLFISFTKSKFATTVSNYTSDSPACMALGLTKGDEVIVQQTHVATAHAEKCGAKIVFADVDEQTGNILISEIKKINKKN